MSMYGTRTISGYGAYELKATYQRNMFLGTLFTVFLVAMTVGSFEIYRALQPEMIVIDLGGKDKKIGGEIVLPPPPDIIKKEPFNKRLRKDMVMPPIVSKLIPIPDDEFNEEEYVMFATKEEVRDFVDDFQDDIRDITKDINYDNIDPNDFGDLPKFGMYVHTEQLPEMIHAVTPVYPSFLRKSGFDGLVYVAVLVDINGDARDAKIVKSSNDAFNKAALDAAKKCRFKPAIQNGIPVACWVTFSFDFELRN